MGSEMWKRRTGTTTQPTPETLLLQENKKLVCS